MTCQKVGLHPKQQPKLFAYAPKLLEYGPSKGKSNIEQPPEAIEDISSLGKKQEIVEKTSEASRTHEDEFVTLEFQAIPRKKIWNDKFLSYEKSSLPTKWSKILEAGLTTKERASVPFWDTRLEENYKNLWLPIKTDSCDGGSNSYKKLYEIPTGESWFSMQKKIVVPKKNSPETSSVSLRYSLPESTVLEAEGTSIRPLETKTPNRGKKQKGNVKTLRIRIFPSKDQAQVVQKMHDQSRWYYNATRNIVYNYHPNLLQQEKVSETALRDLIRKYEYSEEAEVPSKDGTLLWIEKGFRYSEKNNSFPTFPGGKVLHNRIPRGAIYSFARSLNSAISNYHSGNCRSFELKYKSKKRSDKYTTLFEDSRFPKEFLKYRSTYCYTSRIGGKNKRTYTTFNDIYKNDDSPSGFTLEYDCLTGKHYILYTVPIDWYPSNDRRSETQATVNRTGVVSVDPGVRTFLTCYDPSGAIITIGEGANLRLAGLQAKIDYCKSQGLARRTILRLYRKLKDLCKDLHWKAAKVLSSSTELILLPYFRTASMLQGRKLSRKTKQQMQALSFYQFRLRLTHQCCKHQSKLLLVEEDWTSKTCGNCGGINRMLGGSKLFQCSSCELEFDRDENAARNILLKHLPLLNRYASRDSDSSDL